jgi:hypothetical protein
MSASEQDIFHAGDVAASTAADVVGKSCMGQFI